MKESYGEGLANHTSLESVIKPNNIDIAFHSNVINPIAWFDNDQLMQALTNLEKNAVEAMSPGGELSLTLSDNDEQIFIKISDTGEGIKEEDMEKIFTPFFTTKGIGKGTGMGLPLVYSIIKMHRGQIKVESNADLLRGQTGTTFKIELPRRKLNI